MPRYTQAITRDCDNNNAKKKVHAVGDGGGRELLADGVSDTPSRTIPCWANFEEYHVCNVLIRRHGSVNSCATIVKAVKDV